MPSFLAGPPAPRRVWVVRHGRTTANEQGIIQAWEPHELSPTGLAEAQAEAPTWAARDIGWVISSPVLRARQTAHALFGRIDSLDSGWIEEAVPGVAGMTHGESAVAFPELRRADGWPHADAPYSEHQEHRDTVAQRAVHALLRAGLVPGAGDVACVTHGAVVIALCAAAGQPLAEIDNLAALRCTVSETGWELDAIIGPDAQRSRLRDLMPGCETTLEP